MKGTKRRYGHGKYEVYRTEEQLARLYAYNKARETKAPSSYRVQKEDVEKLVSEEGAGRQERLVESLAREFAGEDAKLLSWYRIAFGICLARIPARDREDVAQEIVLAFLRQESRHGPIGEGLARIIAKRIVFHYYDLSRARRIENRSYANILLAKPGKVNLSPDSLEVIPGGAGYRAQVMLRDTPMEEVIGAEDVNLDVAEDKAQVMAILDSLPPAIVPTILAWLDPTRRARLPTKDRVALHRLCAKLRAMLAIS